MPLKVIASPYREITRPVLDYVKRISKESPRTVVTVFIPEYVVGPLVGAGAAQPERAAAQGPAAVQPNVMVTSVPWQLSSSERLQDLQPQRHPATPVGAFWIEQHGNGLSEGEGAGPARS